MVRCVMWYVVVLCANRMRGVLGGVRTSERRLITTIGVIVDSSLLLHEEEQGARRSSKMIQQESE